MLEQRQHGRNMGDVVRGQARGVEKDRRKGIEGICYKDRVVRRRTP